MGRKFGSLSSSQMVPRADLAIVTGQLSYDSQTEACSRSVSRGTCGIFPNVSNHVRTASRNGTNLYEIACGPGKQQVIDRYPIQLPSTAQAGAYSDRLYVLYIIFFCFGIFCTERCTVNLLSYLIINICHVQGTAVAMK